MEDWSRGLLLIGTLLVLIVLGASWAFCLGLSDVVHWTYCEEFLAKADGVRDFVAYLRDTAWRW